MAKFYGSAVKTGKLGGSVFAIRYGETIERQYQPVIANPSTALQVAARAKLKMLSQLAAVIAPTIAMPRVGTMSSRNMFTKVNYPLAVYANNEANINIPLVQLTKSTVALSSVSASRSNDGISVGVVNNPGLDRVVYVIIGKGSGGKLRLIETAVVSEAGSDNSFRTTMTGATSQLFVLAYGVRDNTDAARAVFGNLISPDAEMIAKVITSRTLLETDVTLTETRGTSVPQQA